MRWRLKVELLRAGVPAWQVAQALGIRADLLSKVTTGAIDPSPELREKLASYLGCPEEDLFEDSTEDGVASES